MPSRTLNIFNLYYLFSVFQCDLIAVLFIILSCMSNINSFYQDLYQILWKITKILRPILAIRTNFQPNTYSNT